MDNPWDPEASITEASEFFYVRKWLVESVMGMKRLIKKITLSVILVMIIGILSGCGMITNANAKKNAVNYIKEKYGFTATAKTVKKETGEGLFAPFFTGRYLVEMNYEGKDFGVTIGLNPDTFPGKDNYQAAEIARDFADDIAKLVGKEPYYYQLVYDFDTFDEFDRKYDNYFNDYYDGQNLYDILSSWNGHITMVYLNSTDVRDIDLTPIGEKFTQGLPKDSGRFIIIGLYSFENEAEFIKSKDKVTGREYYMSAFELNRSIPNLYDAQYFRYQQPAKGQRIVYANTDYGYEYRYDTDEKKYNGHGYPGEISE